MKMGLGLSLGGIAISGEAITITAAPLIAQTDTDPQGTATVTSGATSADPGFAIVSSEWVHSVLGDVQSDALAYTKPVDAAYTLRLRQEVSATDLPNRTVYSNTLTVDALLFTAVVTPVISSLDHGTTLSVVPDYDDTYILPDNYLSNAGTVVSVADTYQGTFGGDELAVLAAGETAGFTFTPLDSAGNSAAFVAAPVTVAATVAGAPTSLSATAGNTEIDLAWTAPTSNGGSSITDYLVEVNIAAGGWNTVSDGVGTGTTYTHTGLTNGVAYQYRISTINSVGTSPTSNVDSATQSAADVTAPTMSSLTMGAQSGGNLPITIAGLSEDCDAYWALTSTDQSGATPGDIVDESVANFVDGGTFAATTTGGPYAEAITAGLDASLYLQVVLEDAVPNPSVVYADGPEAIDTSPPVLVPASCTPADGATDIAIDSNITLVFDETLTEGVGNILIREDGVTTQTIAIGSTTVSTTNIVINPADLTNGVDVSVHWQSAVVSDAQGNDVAANVSDTWFNFGTVALGGADFTDNFTRSNQDLATSGDWTNVGGLDLTIVSNQVVGANGSQSADIYAGDTLANDQYVEIEFVDASVTGSVKVLARFTDIDNCYELRARSNGDLQVRKFVAGSASNLDGGGLSSTENITTGETMRLEVTGSSPATIEVFKDGVSLGSRTDSEFTSGDAGFATTSGDTVDNFKCGDL